jgi:Peptidase family M1 domain
MENWGLVTYRETCLLVDPETTSAVRKQYIALVVGHELAHQWFGNLVTMVTNPGRKLVRLLMVFVYFRNGGPISG